MCILWALHMCTTYLGHFEKNRLILVPVSLILKRGPFFRVSMATVVTRLTLWNNLMAHHLAPTILSFYNQRTPWRPYAPAMWYPKLLNFSSLNAWTIIDNNLPPPNAFMTKPIGTYCLFLTPASYRNWLTSTLLKHLTRTEPNWLNTLKSLKLLLNPFLCSLTL